MARTQAELPKGTRITDYISLGVIASRIPLREVEKVLEETGRQSERRRKLPAQVMVYYVIALALYMQSSYGEVLRCLCEGLRWLGLQAREIRRTGRSGISQARSRLGAEPLVRLYRQMAVPLAKRGRSRGAFYRGLRLVSLDGSTLDVADTAENERAFGRPKSPRGRSAFPKLRFVALMEIGTRALFAARMASYQTCEREMADDLIGDLDREMLCLADRGFYSFKRWRSASRRADLLWRVQSRVPLPCLKALEDGSYLSKVYRKRGGGRGLQVRVVVYRLRGAATVYRLITTLLDEQAAPALELAALYHERWEIETALDELKTHLRGRQIVLRSKTPELVRQEFHGLLLAHWAVRGLMHEAALQADLDPDKLSFMHSVRVIRRQIARSGAFPPSAEKSPE